MPDAGRRDGREPPHAVDDVLGNAKVFSAEGLVWLGNTRPLIPLSVDPPIHIKYRKILDPLFAPRRMDAMEEDITGRVNRFIDAFADRGECHFTDEFAVPFPSAVFLGLMGLPWEELDTFLRLKNGILRPGGGSTDMEERQRIQKETGQEIYAYFDAILDERERDPKDDILTHFITSEIDGDKLTREDILDICFLFLIAGLDTVTDSLTCFYAYLGRQRRARAARSRPTRRSCRARSRSCCAGRRRCRRCSVKRRKTPRSQAAR